MKYGIFKQFVEKLGVETEINPIVKHLSVDDDFLGHKEWAYTSGYEIGIKNVSGRKGQAEYNWVWYETYGEELNDDTDLFFRYRFSQLNGKKFGGTREDVKALDSVARRMGMTFEEVLYWKPC